MGLLLPPERRVCSLLYILTWGFLEKSRPTWSQGSTIKDYITEDSYLFNYLRCTGYSFNVEPRPGIAKLLTLVLSNNILNTKAFKSIVETMFLWQENIGTCLYYNSLILLWLPPGFHSELAILILLELLLNNMQHALFPTTTICFKLAPELI